MSIKLSVSLSTTYLCPPLSLSISLPPSLYCLPISLTIFLSTYRSISPSFCQPPSLPLSLSLFAFLSIFLFVYLSINLPAGSMYPSFYLSTSVSVPIYLSIYRSIGLPIDLAKALRLPCNLRLTLRAWHEMCTSFCESACGNPAAAAKSVRDLAKAMCLPRSVPLRKCCDCHEPHLTLRRRCTYNSCCETCTHPCRWASVLPGVAIKLSLHQTAEGCLFSLVIPLPSPTLPIPYRVKQQLSIVAVAGSSFQFS